MQPEMALHRVECLVRLGYVSVLFIMHQDVVTSKVVFYPLWEAQIAVVLPVVKSPKLFYGVRIRRADGYYAGYWMCEGLVWYDGQP